jgi:hypothetical protein
MNHLKTIHKTPQQHNWTAQRQVIIANSHTGHCTHTAESADVKVQNIFNVRNNITCAKLCNYRSRAKIYPRNMGCFRHIIIIMGVVVKALRY